MAEDKAKTVEKPKTASTAPVTPDKPAKMPTWKKIAIGVVVFFVAVFAFGFLITRDAQKAADAFKDDIVAGNCAAVFEKTAAEFREVTSEAEWTEFCETLSPVLASSNVSANGVSYDSDNAQVDGEVGEAHYKVTNGDDSTTLGIQMIKVDGEWLLYGIDPDLQVE